MVARRKAIVAPRKSTVARRKTTVAPRKSIFKGISFIFLLIAGAKSLAGQESRLCGQFQLLRRAGNRLEQWLDY